MNIYNSRGKINQVLEEENVGMYMCGPTVYDKVHIGNLRTFLFGDIVYRTLKYFGKNVKNVMNITDVDDKILKKMDGSGLDELFKVTQHYEKLFIDNLTLLGVKLPEFHRVTDNMNLVIEMIEKLMECECAYQTNDGSVYYDTSKNNEIYKYFDIHINNDEYKSGREIIKSDGLKSKNDFVLWKSFNAEHDKYYDKNVFWDGGDILGYGRPGWHIECSAIASHYLDEVTLHLGGEDLKFPHHTNEVAQSESANPTKCFGKYWMHASYLNLKEENEEGELVDVKMSKSLGNVVYLEDLVKEYNPLVVRMYLNYKHYRRCFSFNKDDLESFVERVHDIYRTFARLKNFYGKNLQNSTLKKGFAENFEKTVTNHFKDNLRTDYAFDEWEKMCVTIRNSKRITKVECIRLSDAFERIDLIFGIMDWDAFNVDEETLNKVALRDELRKEKKYEETDRMRLEIQKKNVFEDDSSGYILFKKRF
jgi:cysteinyl-tRNA synthetase